mmetsp:Transcript_5634/g.14302  ORF Transcript_5634/g.14302 Transcript_5634/m.14302 type:complete len:203 (+) Transcript_5634:2-610(+)
MRSTERPSKPSPVALTKRRAVPAATVATEAASAAPAAAANDSETMASPPSAIDGISPDAILFARAASRSASALSSAIVRGFLVVVVSTSADAHLFLVSLLAAFRGSSHGRAPAAASAPVAAAPAAAPIAAAAAMAPPGVAPALLFAAFADCPRMLPLVVVVVVTSTPSLPLPPPPPPPPPMALADLAAALYSGFHPLFAGLL